MASLERTMGAPTLSMRAKQMRGWGCSAGQMEPNLQMFCIQVGAALPNCCCALQTAAAVFASQLPHYDNSLKRPAFPEKVGEPLVGDYFFQIFPVGI